MDGSSASDREVATRSRRWPWILLVVVLAFLAYVPALGNDFAFDDTLARSTTNDGRPDKVIGRDHAPWHHFTNQYWAGENRESHLYRPVTILSYTLTYQYVAKPFLDAEHEAFPHHLINLLLNAWAAYLVFSLMLDLRLGIFGAALTAAIFGVHALHSEVVASIFGRAELLSFCLGAVGILAYRRAERSRRWLWIPVSGLMFFGALCSKESAVAWLPLLPCYLAARAWRCETVARPYLLSGAWRMAGALVPALVVFLVLRGMAVEGWRTDVFYAANPLYHEPDVTRLLTAIKTWGYALYKCVAPFWLASLYGPWALGLVESPADPGFLAAAAALLLWLIAGLRRPTRTPLLFLSVAIFFGFSFITSNVPFAIGTIFGERIYFVPSLGVCMLPALLMPRLSGWWRRATLGICLVWILANIAVDLHRSTIWKNNETLMLNDAVAQPNCASLQAKAAGVHRWLQGERPERKEFHEKEAWRFLRLAQKIDPDYVSSMSAEATFLAHDKKFDAAIAVMEKALEAKRIKTCGLEAGIRGELGMLLLTEKKRKRAGLEQLEMAVKLRPRSIPYRAAWIEHGMGVLEPERLRAVLIEGIEMHPEEVIFAVLQAAFLYVYAEQSTKSATDIVEILEGVFRAVPEEAMADKRYIEARLQLADCLAALGQKDEARASYEIVLPLPKATEDQKKRARDGIAQTNK